MNWPTIVLLAVIGFVCLLAIWDARRINRKHHSGSIDTRYFLVSERRLAKRDEEDARLALRTQRTIERQVKQ